MITGIDHIDISVKDVEAAVKLFEKVGFKVLRRQGHHAGTAEVALPGPNQFIFDLHPATEEHIDGGLGLIHIAFKVDDPNKLHEQLEKNGLALNKEHENVKYVKATGRTLFNVLSNGSTDCLGDWYLQFVGPGRKDPAP